MLYHSLTVEGRSLLEAAERFGMKPQEVAVFRQQMRDWIVHTTPRSDLTREQLQLADEKLAVERMEYLYGQAMEAWRASQKDQVVSRTTGSGTATYTTTQPCGKVCYLITASRILERLGNFQQRMFAASEKLHAALAGQDHGQADRPRRGAGESPAAGSSPPVRDCSPIADGSDRAPPVLPSDESVIADPDCTSDDTLRQRMEFLAPLKSAHETVQSEDEGAERGVLPVDTPTAADVCISGSQPGFYRRPLSRKERRRRARELAKHRRRAK
jgi:hypothetical protein